jgi:hypothetical protein
MALTLKHNVRENGLAVGKLLLRLATQLKRLNALRVNYSHEDATDSPSPQ